MIVQQKVTADYAVNAGALRAGRLALKYGITSPRVWECMQVWAKIAAEARRDDAAAK